MNTTLRDLVKSLGSQNGLERKRARETIVLVKEPVTPLLQSLLDEGDKRVRWEAAKTLATTIDPSAMDTLIELLTTYDSDIRWIAADGLIKLGPRTVIPLLRSLLTDKIVKGQAEMTARVLRQLATENEVLNELVTPVIEALKDPDPALVQPKVQRALSDISAATGELPVI
ncbi:MAG: HEAT repeat domain-containing protein [Thermoleophilia bacterium]|jgi:HEAT repeat protein